MIAAQVEVGGLQRLARRIGGLLALAGRESDHVQDAQWWAKRLHPHAVAASEGRRSKYLATYATMEERLGVGTEEGHEWLRALKFYTWRRSPFAGVRRTVRGRYVFRTVSTKSPAGSWYYPPKVWTRTRRWRTKSGAVHSRTTVHATPARDMKPGLLRARKYVVVAMRAQQRYVPPASSRRIDGTRPGRRA